MWSASDIQKKTKAELKKVIQQLLNEKQTLQERIEVLEKQYALLFKELSVSKNKSNIMESLAKQLDEKNKMLKNKQNLTENKPPQTESEQISSQNWVEKKKRKIQALKKELQDYKDLIKAYEVWNEELREQIKKKDETISDLHNQNTQLQSESQDWKKLYNKELQDPHGKKATQDEIENYRKTIKAKEKELAQKGDIIQNQKNEHHNLYQRFDQFEKKMEEKIDKLTDIVQKQDNEIRQLKVENKKQDDKIKKLEDRVDTLETLLFGGNLKLFQRDIAKQIEESILKQIQKIDPKISTNLSLNELLNGDERNKTLNAWNEFQKINSTAKKFDIILIQQFIKHYKGPGNQIAHIYRQQLSSLSIDQKVKIFVGNKEQNEVIQFKQHIENRLTQILQESAHIVYTENQIKVIIELGNELDAFAID